MNEIQSRSAALYHAPLAAQPQTETLGKSSDAAMPKTSVQSASTKAPADIEGGHTSTNSSIEEALKWAWQTHHSAGLQLGATGKAGEQDLFTASVMQQLENSHPELVSTFKERFSTEVDKLLQKDDPQALFKACDRALRASCRDGSLSNSEYTKFLRVAFGKAQLDGNHSSLAGLDSKSSASQTNLLSALAAYQGNSSATSTELATFQESLKPSDSAQAVSPSGVVSAHAVPTPPHSSSSLGSSLGGLDLGICNLFLWKPISDSDGELAVLLPAAMTGKAASVQILSPDGKTVLATGRYSGVGNGQRMHFRFDQPGGSFPAGSLVRIQMNDGSTKTIQIPNTSARNEY